MKLHRTIRFVLDGSVVEVDGGPPTRTVLEYLRNDLGRIGTKEGCAEGDCGACTVVLGELGHDENSISYQAINSCIRFLPTLDGKALVTVESLRCSKGASLHPVQRAMVDLHASQCGFCTPGFVMSLFSLYLSNATPTRDEVLDALSGNLCRCTGYRPIIDAAGRMDELEAPTSWSRADAQSLQRIEALRGIQRKAAGISLSFDGYHAPRSLDELAETLLAAPHSLILAGGTDVGLWVTKELRDLPPLIYIGDVPELNVVSRAGSGLRIGAAVQMSRAWPALVAEFPALAEQSRRFASRPIQNSATLGGNVANGSPVGDSMPALIALGAQVELRRGARRRVLPLESFYLGYRRKDLEPGEFIVAIVVPNAPANLLFGSYKLAKRFEQDISAVSAGFAVQVQDGVVVEARLAFGGMAARPSRALAAEAALRGQLWNRESCDEAIRALPRDFQPLTDMRATHEYRLRAAGNLLRRFYLAQSGTADPLSVSAVAPEEG